MQQKQQNANVGSQIVVSFIIILQLLLVIGKAAHIIDWGWGVVLIPLWFMIGLTLLTILIGMYIGSQVVRSTKRSMDNLR